MSNYEIFMLLAGFIGFLGLYFIIPGAYIGVRLLLGHHITDTMRESEEFKRGIELAEQERYQEAIEYFDTVLINLPKSAVAWAYKARCNFALDNLNEAIYDCDKATNADYSLSDCYLIKGQALLQLQQYKKAHDEFGRAVWFFKDKAVPYRWKGLANYHLGKLEEAKVDFEKAVRLGDEDANDYLLKLQSKMDTR
ncbi:MAG TPA: hypothetical protein DCS93_41245 [Microscillaceae bacterium]|nr:hypothetical protein [Microscillaceae bacterium]